MLILKQKKPTHVRENTNKAHEDRTPEQALTLVTGILLSVLFTSLISVWPQHNVFEEPNYWYEAAIACTAGLIFLVEYILLQNIKSYVFYILNFHYRVSCKKFSKSWQFWKIKSKEIGKRG